MLLSLEENGAYLNPPLFHAIAQLSAACCAPIAQLMNINGEKRNKQRREWKIGCRTHKWFSHIRPAQPGVSI